MSDRFRISLLVPLFLVGLTACAKVTPVATPDSGKEPPTILVVGKGVVEKAPDAFYVGLWVSTCGSSLDVSLEENNGRMREVLDYLKQAGIQEGDVGTTMFSLRRDGPQYFNFCYPEAPYEVRNGIQLTIRDIQRAGEILAGVIGRGINGFGDMYFFLQDPSGAILEARQKAIQDAKAKAQALADGLGRKLGDPIKTVEGDVTPSLIREVNVTYGQAYMYGRGGGGGGDGGIPLAIGNVDITVTVNITYEVV